LGGCGKLKKEPGTIAVIGDEDFPSFLGPILSTHHVGLSDLLFVSSFMGTRLSVFALAGIRPETVEIGLELSKTVMDLFEQLSPAILENPGSGV
jgi:hydrogenase maturation protease